MKVLVTGASGFVGTHLVESAKALGWKVHAAVRKSSNIEAIRSYVDMFVYVDQSDLDALKTLFVAEKYDYIIHAAALTKAKTEKELYSVNVLNTKNILEAAFSIEEQPKRVVFVSSLAAIGPIDYDAKNEIVEDSQYNPLTAYGRSKKDAEIMIKSNFGDKSISVFRPTAVYGPREKDLFILFDTLNKGLDPYIGRKPQKLSFVYVQDLVDVLLLGCTKEQTKLEFFNISDGNVYSRFAMADVFKETFLKKPIRVFLPYALVSLFAKISALLYKRSVKVPTIYPERLGELTASNWSCSINKAVKLLGYSPKFDLRSGLTKSLLWYKENNWLK